MVEFVLTGAPAPAPKLVPEPSKAFAFISRLCTYLPLIVLVSAVAVLAWFGVLPESFRIPATVPLGSPRRTASSRVSER